MVEAFAATHPDTAALNRRILQGDLPAGWDAELAVFTGKPVATRDAAGRTLNVLAARLPELIGGAADLAPSTKTLLDNEADIDPMRRAGRNARFGIREHAMGACLNGLIFHDGLLPYGATFLVFSDYMRSSLRLAALMQTHVIYVLTHDSIGLGEDGPRTGVGCTARGRGETHPGRRPVRNGCERPAGRKSRPPIRCSGADPDG